MMRRTLRAVVGVIAVFLVVRGVVEVATLHYPEPSSYSKDWGGPSLLGVLAVHAGPGLGVLAWAFARLRSRGNSLQERHSS